MVALPEGLIGSYPTLSVVPAARPPGAKAGLEEWLDYQQRVHPRSIELGLERVRAVASKLGLPSAGIITLTVGGTNGKGSTATLAAHIYRQSGYHTGLYRSPHLLRYNERVVIDDVEATDDALCRAFSRIESARGDIALTYFEFGTLAALWLFREAGVQVQVLEVGLGGRLDAVNIVDADCAVVTNIGLDHQDWLGVGLEAIGFEKAGIFRPGKPAVIADSQAPQSLKAEVARLGCKASQLGADYQFERSGSRWTWSSKRRTYRDLPLPGLSGRAQIQNAAGVIAAIEALQGVLPVTPDALSRSLPRLVLPGRFEQRGRWWLDVAHNTEAAQALADNLLEHRHEPAPWLVLGMLADKPVEGVAAVLAPVVAGAVFVGLPAPRGQDAQTLRARAASVGLTGTAIEDVDKALQYLFTTLGADVPVLICGSFLTVALALDALNRGLPE